MSQDCPICKTRMKYIMATFSHGEPVLARWCQNDGTLVVERATAVEDDVNIPLRLVAEEYKTPDKDKVS